MWHPKISAAVNTRLSLCLSSRMLSLPPTTASTLDSTKEGRRRIKSRSMTLGSRHSQQIIGHKFRHDQNTESVDQVLLISQLRARRTEGIHPASCAVLHQTREPPATFLNIQLFILSSRHTGTNKESQKISFLNHRKPEINHSQESESKNDTSGGTWVKSVVWKN